MYIGLFRLSEVRRTSLRREVCEMEKMQSKMKKGVWKTIVLWLVILLLLLFFAGLLPIAPSAVLTGSMNPEIEAGDVVLIDRTVHADLSKGDIIQFRRNGHTVVHRIVEMTQTEDGRTAFITKGDANNAPDSGQVLPDQVIGRYLFRIPKLGCFSMWLSLLRT